MAGGKQTPTIVANFNLVCTEMKINVLSHEIHIMKTPGQIVHYIVIFRSAWSVTYRRDTHVGRALVLN